MRGIQHMGHIKRSSSQPRPIATVRVGPIPRWVARLVQPGYVGRCRRSAIGSGVDQATDPIEKEEAMTVFTPPPSHTRLTRKPLLGLAAAVAIAAAVGSAVPLGHGEHAE